GRPPGARRPHAVTWPVADDHSDACNGLVFTCGRGGVRHPVWYTEAPGRARRSGGQTQQRGRKAILLAASGCSRRGLRGGRRVRYLFILGPKPRQTGRTRGSCLRKGATTP